MRDAEASRAAFDGYVKGLEQAAARYHAPDEATAATLFDEGEHE
jgi:hypothetical protein